MRPRWAWASAEPAQSILGQGCFWQNTPLCLAPLFSSSYILISSQTGHSAYQKIRGPFLIYLWVPQIFLVFHCIIDLGIFTVKCKFDMRYIFFLFKK
jgi:hypothetical protein